MKTPIQTINLIAHMLKTQAEDNNVIVVRMPTQFEVASATMTDLGLSGERYPNEFQHFIGCLPQLCNQVTFHRIMRSKNVINNPKSNNWKALRHLLSYLPAHLPPEPTTKVGRIEKQKKIANELLRKELNLN